MDLITLRLDELHPYERNPRRNDKAVDAVAESIKQCGYVAPIIVDEQHVILAGHTRYKALRKLGHDTAQVIVRGGAHGGAEEEISSARQQDERARIVGPGHA